jgi:hypothetical protein
MHISSTHIESALYQWRDVKSRYKAVREGRDEVIAHLERALEAAVRMEEADDNRAWMKRGVKNDR